MKPYHAVCILVAALLLHSQCAEGRRRKHKGDDHEKSEQRKTKTKTKWSSSTDLGGINAHVSSEEHGYYVKRTYSPTGEANKKQLSPPFLAIPIAWFSCGADTGCQTTSNSGGMNGAAQALSEGFLCDDDCNEPYAPICGKTPTEVAVFYNKCKLNVAKCRTHGLWADLPYEQCQQTYPKETAYTDKKFKASPYFSATNAVDAQPDKPVELPNNNVVEGQAQPENNVEPIAASSGAPRPTAKPLEAAMAAALDEINAKITEAEKVVARDSIIQVQADKDRLQYKIA
ncbi:uncharacterized protein LOC115634044 [Scaptodrosophila lebanonensis]|uniref:Uncharacterized protein LOC115634044 n=1 Tax=Drosophila lebanonensis TaxID=7225 RepID=A0A6J2UG70_DROLE|nr:uncharacterized protein LOC115634044 [Scaptodrosophila lebanonensis]